MSSKFAGLIRIEFPVSAHQIVECYRKGLRFLHALGINISQYFTILLQHGFHMLAFSVQVTSFVRFACLYGGIKKRFNLSLI